MVSALHIGTFPIFDALRMKEANDRKIVIEILENGIVVDIARRFEIKEEPQTMQIRKVYGVNIGDNGGRRGVFQQIEDLRLQR